MQTNQMTDGRDLLFSTPSALWILINNKETVYKITNYYITDLSITVSSNFDYLNTIGYNTPQIIRNPPEMEIDIHLKVGNLESQNRIKYKSDLFNSEDIKEFYKIINAKFSHLIDNLEE